jgi:hypothetical protein
VAARAAFPYRRAYLASTRSGRATRPRGSTSGRSTGTAIT